MSETTQAQPSARAGRREWIGLAVLALPTLLLSLDMSVLYLALPHLSADLHADATQQLWIMDIYGFMIAGFLITMGTLGDRIGRRRLLLIGAAAFGAASVLAAYSTSPEMLIATRAILGIAGATLMPSTLALISNMFADARQRGMAIAIWISCFMGGATLGPVVGGALLENFWWGSAFLIGVPVMVLLLVVGPVLLPEYRAPEPGRLDLISVTLSLATILPVIYGLKELAKDGWAAVPVAAVVAGAVVGVLFVRRQNALPLPLLDLRLFRNRTFSAALVVWLLFGSIQGGTYLFFTLYLQTVSGFTPLEAGLWLLPGALGMIPGTLIAPVVARRIRPGYVMAAGLGTAAVGNVLFTGLDSSGGVTLLVLGMVVSLTGVGFAAALGADMIVGSVPPAKAGSAAAISETSGEFGIALGVATLGSVITAIYRNEIAGAIPSDVPGAAAGDARESITGAVSVAADLPDPLRAAVLEPAREAFTTGLTSLAALSAILFVGLSVLAAVALRHVKPSGDAGESGHADQASRADDDIETIPVPVPVTD